MATRSLLKSPARPVVFDGLGAVAEASRARSSEAATSALSMLTWSMRAPEPISGPLNFAWFPFQREWYSDEIAQTPEVVWMKSSQIGMSAYAWRWCMRQSDQFGDTTLYIFPSLEHVREFGDERIEPSVEASEYLRSRIQRQFVRHKSLKRIGNGWMHLRGSNSKAGAQSVAAQAVVFDEYDHLDPSNLPQIERRISGAKQIGRAPKIRRLGNPTVPDMGIDLAFQGSDRRYWHVRCGGCGDEQPIEWDANVRWAMPHSERVHRPGFDAADLTDKKLVGRVWRACRRCDRELDVSEGRWVAMNPGATVVGFHASRLLVPNTDLQQIVVASRATKLAEVEAFHWNDLGVAYSPSDASLDDAAIRAAASFGIDCQQGYGGQYAVTGGLDTASERDMSLRISEQLPDGRRRALYIGNPTSFGEVAEIIRNFRVHTLVVDGQPERKLARTLAAAFPGRVHLAKYADEMDDPMLFDPETNIVTVHRTDAIDGMMDSIRQQRNVPLRDPSALYLAQMKALKRRTVEKADGKVRRVYVKTGTQGDDFAHAEVYDMVATLLWQMKVQLEQRFAEQREQHLPDEQIGFRRLRLGLDGLEDEYIPGFRGGV